MSERVEKALEYHRKGFNCAQAVVCAYCDLVGLDFQTAFKVSEGFGLGMGKLGQTCGAVSGMFFLASMKNSDGNVEAPATKRATYALVNELGQAFKEKNTSICCDDLLGGEGKPKLRSCPGCIEDAARIVEAKLFDL